MKKPKMTQAFTIIELTVVMAIILIIAGMVMGVGRKARIMAMEARAETMIAALEVAIGMYHADTGQYPDESSNATLVTDLTEDPGDVPGQRGPYMEFKDKDLSSSGSEVVDPWGFAYDYMIMKEYSGTKWGNTSSYNLWSYGVNKNEDSFDEGSPDSDYGDDIYNW